MALPPSNTTAPAHNATSVALRVAVRLAVALACVAGVVVSITSRDSRIEGEVALRYLAETSDARGGIDRLEEARRLNPNAGIDIVESKLVPPREGIAILLRALKEEPENAELWVALADAQARAGDRAAAERTWQRARALAPSFLPPDGPPGG
jgi:predicted Zn-dependent protease